MNYYGRGKVLLIMKLTLVLLISFSLALHATGFGQKISLNVKNESIETVLSNLEKQTSYRFLYRDDALKNTVPVSLNIRHSEIETVLNELFKDQGLAYEIIAGTINVIAKKPIKTVISAAAFAQKQLIGNVKNESGEPLIGVSVRIKGTNKGTSTDALGAFSIAVTPNEILTFSYIGFIPQEVEFTNQSSLAIKMLADDNAMNEVVVVGYGTQSRETITTSISKMDNKVLENVPYANAASALQGSLSGVRVQSTSGQPGAAPRIIVRGGTSINNPNGASPLYIIDGVTRSDMNDINSYDIESIQILKDAAATAIYGARGSNGVVIITTKSGISGSTQVSYNYNLMSSNVGEEYDLVSARDFIKFYRLGVMATARKIPERLALLEQATAGGTGNDLTMQTSFTTQYLTPENEHKLREGWESMADPLDPTKTIIFKGTNWQDILYRTGISHNHALSFSGGTEKSTFNLGLGYLDNEGVAIGTDYKRLSLNLNGDFKVKDNLTTFGRVLYSKSFTNGAGWTYARGQALAPTAKYLLEDGSLAPGVNSNYRNPEYYTNSQDNRDGKDNLTLAVGANWLILPRLSFEPQISLYTTSVNQRSFQKAAYINGPNGLVNSRAASGNHSDMIQYQADAVLSYLHSFANHHNISIKGGFSYNKRENNALGANGQAAASDLIPTLNASATPVSVNGSESSLLIMGYFSRLNYDYRQKYLLSVSARYDGASNLGDNYKWGVFPGVSIGWNVHKEGFWSSIPAPFSQLKLRGSYGINGNISGLGNYQAQGEYKVGGLYAGSSAIVNSILANAELQWERSKTLNFGFDLGLFNNRVNIISDIYRRKTDNLLTSLPLPPSTGFADIYTNLGSLENKGLEVEISVKALPSESEFQWDMSFNVSKVKNKILKLPENGVENNRVGGYYLWDQSANNYAWLGGLQEGGTIGDLFAFKQIGIYATDEEAATAPLDMIISTIDKTKYGGDVNWLDVDKNDTIDMRDRVYMGNIYPTWTGGFSNYFSYKNFRLAVRMDYTLGHTKYNWSRALILSQFGTASGIVTDVLRSWQEQGDVTDIPRYYWADQQTQRNIARGQATIDEGNSEFMEPGSFLSVRELTLSYVFPKTVSQKLKLSNLSLNLTGHNLYYFTKFKGLNPEDGGQDNGGYPLPRNILLGLKVNF